MEYNPTVPKPHRETKIRSEIDMEQHSSAPESPSPKLRSSQTLKSSGPSSPLVNSQKVEVDLSKMTERQQIAYLLRESNGGIELPVPKEVLTTDKPEKQGRRASAQGVKRPSVEELDETWSSEEKPKRRKKDKPRKAGEIRNNQTKPTRKQRKNEAICTICEDGGNLLMCEGPCLRSFHTSCLSIKTPPPDKWECDDCSKQMNQCFACKQKGSIDRDLMKCKVHQCGKYYHYRCVTQLKLTKLINTKAKRFNCPLHYCATCEVSGDGKQSAHCFRCPTAYHVICMPSAARLLTDKSKETRKTGLILCPKHINDSQQTSIDPGATLLFAAEAELSEDAFNGSSAVSSDNDSEDSDGGRYSNFSDDSQISGVEVDRAAEEAHMRHTVLYRDTITRGKMDTPKGKNPLQWSQILPPPPPMESRHRGLDDVEREIMAGFDREAHCRFGIDLNIPQPPKQRQKKLDRIQMLEKRFREDLAAYKASLVSKRDMIFARNQIDFESKVQLLRSEHHRLDVETEETLTHKFEDWGERILEQKRNALKNMKIDETSLCHTNNNDTPGGASALPATKLPELPTQLQPLIQESTQVDHSEFNDKSEDTSLLDMLASSSNTSDAEAGADIFSDIMDLDDHYNI